MLEDDVENNVAVIEESAAPETSHQKHEDAASSEPAQDDPQEKNWREMRRKNSELERKARAQEELISLFVKQQSVNQSTPSTPVDELDSVPDGDYIPKGEVRKMIQREKESIKREAREEAQKLLQEREQSNFHQRLQQKFSDFDEVVTSETLELLEQQDPELAATIVELKDPFKMGLQTYKYIKSMGLTSKAPAQRRTQEVAKRMEKNEKTLQSPQAYDKRPMAQTFQLTEKMKKDLWKEMNGYAQLAGGVPDLRN